MPYGTNFWNINPETWFPDLSIYPKAWSDQWTRIPEGFIAPKPLTRIKINPCEAVASWKKDIHDILDT